MKKLFKLGIIGCGFMSSAIIKGVMQAEFIRPKKLIVSDMDENKLNNVNSTYGVSISDDNRFVAQNSEYLLIAVAPQDFSAVAEELEGVCPNKVISVMVGVKKSTVKNALGVSLIRVASCVPNLPCEIGYGMTAVDMTDFNKNTDDLEFILNLFGCVGEVLSLTEDKLEAAAAISGSGVAYFYMFVDSVIDEGVKLGLSKTEAQTLAVQTALGSFKLLSESDKPLSQLIMEVCAKNVAALEAVKSLESNNFRCTVGEAVEACAKRGKELSKK